MKRDLFLFILVIILPILQQCKTDAPATITIISCTLIDEDNKPVEGEVFTISGYYRKGLSGIPTFYENIKTDKDGKFRYEKQIPFNTEQADIAPYSAIKQFQFINTDGQYQLVSSPLRITMGQENTFNFKLLKK